MIKELKEKVDNFQEDRLLVDFWLLIKKIHGGTKTNRDRKKYSERREVLDKIVSEVKEELNRDKDYGTFRRKLNNCQEKTESISSRLTKYVEEYISIVDI